MPYVNSPLYRVLGFRYRRRVTGRQQRFKTMNFGNGTGTSSDGRGRQCVTTPPTGAVISVRYSPTYYRLRFTFLYTAQRSTADWCSACAQVGLHGGVYRDLDRSRPALWCESAWPGQAAHPAGSYKYSSLSQQRLTARAPPRNDDINTDIDIFV